MIKRNLVGLRAVEEEDLPILRDWRNIPEFRKNFREVRELNLAHQRSWFQNKCVNSPNDFMFTIVNVADNRPIGACGLLYINWIIRSADVSFYIGQDNAYIDTKGYAKEAAALLIQYGFGNLNLHKVWMELYAFDKLKIDFFTREFGFQIDGQLRDNCYEDNRYYDSYILSLINKKEA